MKFQSEFVTFAGGSILFSAIGFTTFSSLVLASAFSLYVYLESKK